MADTTSERWLGIDGGGTRTVAVLADGDGETLRRLEAGPANLKLLNDAQLTQQFRSLAASLPHPDGIAIGLAGAWEESDRKRIWSAAGKVWRGVPCYATSDLEIALTAAANSATDRHIRQILIVSGTGSGCYGKTRAGTEIKIGAWGHVLGDRGSGYGIGLSALRAVVASYDQEGAWPQLGRRFLRALQLNTPGELIAWAQAATKTEIASLAVEVLALWPKDKIAVEVLRRAAESLANDAAICARRVASRHERIQFVLAGGLLLRQPSFARQVSRALHRLHPQAETVTLKRESVCGAVDLARKHSGQRAEFRSRRSDVTDQKSGVRSARMSPTEQRNPRSMKLDELSVEKAVGLMLSEDAGVPRRLLGERKRIAKAVAIIGRAFRRSGRLFYVGTGTSGRLGVLDASECPPTFRTPPELVQGIIAGGQTALWRSVEGAEDDTRAGKQALEYRGLTARDVVVGIAASGTTPYVWGALGEARRRGASTVLICFNPFLVIPRDLRPTIVIAPNLGPEVLTGSTRLKAGTATKLILNIFTTLAMVRMGKVKSNLMVDLLPANAKLRDRAVRIVQELTRADYERAKNALTKTNWAVKKAVALLKRRSKLRARGISPGDTRLSQNERGQ